MPHNPKLENGEEEDGERRKKSNVFPVVTARAVTVPAKERVFLEVPFLSL